MPSRTIICLVPVFWFMEPSHRAVLATMILSSLLMVGVSLPGVLLPGPVSNTSTPPPEGIEPLSDQVLLVVLDGVPRSVFDDPNIMPFVSSFEQDGLKVPVLSSELTLTGACIKEMATGRNAVPMDAIRNWEVSNEVRNDPFYHAEFQGNSVAFTGFYVWQNLYPELFFTHETSPDFGFDDIRLADDHAMEVVEGWMTTNRHNLMVAHLGGTDHAAHIHGLDSPIYEQRMKQLDHQLEDLFNTVPDNWTVLLTSDHGVTNYGGHALGTGAVAEEVYLFARGEGIASPQVLTSPIAQRDISVLISALMGLPLPVSSDAVVPLEMLDITSAQKPQYERWNWENVLAHHAFMERAGGEHIDSLPNEPDWALLDESQEDVPILPVLVSLVVVGGMMAWCVVNRSLSPVRFERTAFQNVVIPLVVVCFVTVGLLARDQEVLLSGRWLRKLLGTFGVGALVVWMMVDRKRMMNFQIAPLFMVTAGLLFLFPETRYSTLAIFLAPFGLYALWTKGKRYFSLQERCGLSVLLGLMVHHLVDYLPRFLTNMSLQALLDVDLLYKPMQRLVHGSMVSNPLMLMFVWLGVIGIMFTQKVEQRFVVQWRPVVFVTTLMVFAAFQTTLTDWAIIVFMLWTVRYALNSARSQRFEQTLGIRPIEAIVLSWVGPTWGFFPAFCVVFVGRIAPSLKDMVATLTSNEDSEQRRTAQQVLSSLTGVCLLFLIWFHFSLLTPLGLLEYNPSKVIVTGGFFGARSAPSLGWMGLMIVGPTLLSLGYTYFSWTNKNPKDGTLLLVGLFLLSHATVFWTSALFTEYFVMLSTGLLFYSTVLAVGFLVEVRGWFTVDPPTHWDQQEIPTR